MNIEQLGTWVKTMNKIREGNILIPISDMVMTPNEYLAAAMTNNMVLTKLGAKQLASMDDLKDIIKERIRARYAEGRLHTLYSGEGIVTPEERMAEVEKESVAGMRFINADYKFMQEMIKRL